MSATLPSSQTKHAGVLSRLCRDTAGNVLAMIAISLFPLIGLLGGGLDIGRGYLAQSRLQQACDAGVLAARKRLGAEVAVDGDVPDEVADAGDRFFNINFRDGAYGTKNREFTMTLESDYGIAGTASVEVPTTLMYVFGFKTMDVSVDCKSILNFTNLDVMMVLDTTGSMRITNPGDTLSRLDSLREVIRDFHTLLEASKAGDTEIRYGFVPYATNVNVGNLLQDDWVADTWTYQSREQGEDLLTVYTHYTSGTNWEYVSGTRSAWAEESRYDATYTTGTPPPDPSGDQITLGSSGWYQCTGSQPGNTRTIADTKLNETTETVVDPDGERRIEYRRRVHNGMTYRTRISGTTCIVERMLEDNFTENYQRIWEPRERSQRQWKYDALVRDMAEWRTQTPGCIEERATYEISDYDNVDFSRALDLDIDLVPTPGNPATQWKPWDDRQIYLRNVKASDWSGPVSKPAETTIEQFYHSGNDWYSVCPPPAQRLTAMNASELDAYLATLSPNGATYHDIGMIWGGRLLSPTGLFAADNADTDSRQRTRHMIWLTDGVTEPYPWAYGAYGLEVLDERRWSESSTATLTQTVESRFRVACEQVKNRNIVVWVVAFGTGLTDIMNECAGPGRAFEAANADELNDAFMEIARSMSELRISQ